MNVRNPSRRQATLWRKLKKKKYRQSEKLFLAEGERCVSQILQNRFITVEALLRSEHSQWDPGRIDAEVFELEESEFETIADTENPQGVAAVCRIPAELPVSELAVKTGLVVAADAVRDPGNLGTMIRTASWFDADALLCGTGTVDPYNSKVVRSTAGATGSLPVISGDLHELFLILEEKDWQILILDGGEGAITVKNADRSKKTVLVVGNEANGVDRRLVAANRERIKIEGESAVVESLNAAIAAGIALYELNRTGNQDF